MCLSVSLRPSFLLLISLSSHFSHVIVSQIMQADHSKAILELLDKASQYDDVSPSMTARRKHGRNALVAKELMYSKRYAEAQVLLEGLLVRGLSEPILLNRRFVMQPCFQLQSYFLSCFNCS